MRPLNRRIAGFTLVELMVAMVLGLMVILAVTNLFLSTRQTGRQNDNLARMQENARIVFELLGRDLRGAGQTPCGNLNITNNFFNTPLYNVLKTRATPLFSFGVTPGAPSWQPILGYDGNFNPATVLATAPARVSAPATDAVIIHRVQVIENLMILPSANPSEIVLNRSDHGLKKGDIVMVCGIDPGQGEKAQIQAAIFQVTGPVTPGKVLQHSASEPSVLPGNCNSVLGAGNPDSCSATAPADFTGGLAARLQSVAWYAGKNPRGGNSLYRIAPVNQNGAIAPAATEVAEGIADFQIEYLVGGSAAFVAAPAVSNWSTVKAVRATLVLQSLDKVDGATFTYPFSAVFYLRN